MSTLRAPRRRVLAAGLCGLLLLASCGSSEQALDEYVSLPPLQEQQVSGLTTTTASGVEPSGVASGSVTSDASAAVPGSVSLEVFDDVERFYDDYLQARANVIDRTDEPTTIDEFVTEAGRADVLDALAANDELQAEERLSAVDSLWLFSNVDSISQLDDQTILIVDCTEQHEVNRLDQFWALWVTNEVRIDTSTGDMRVDSYTTTHNGFLEADAPLGCAPLSFQERAEAAAAQAWTDLAVWSRNVDERIESELSPHIGDPLRQQVLDNVATTGTLQADNSTENSTFTAAGLNTLGRLGAQGAEDIVIVVQTCHRFPEGRTGINTATQSAISDLPPGAEQALQFQVHLDPSRAERVDKVIAIDYIADRCAS